MNTIINSYFIVFSLMCKDLSSVEADRDPGKYCKYWED